jgi:SAM-dependent methyltransferase
MSKPRRSRPDPTGAIDDVMLGASRIQALYVATRLGIPDLLAHGPRTSTVLASTTGVHPGALHRLLRFLVAEGFFEMGEGGEFSLTPRSEVLLTSSPTGTRGYVISTATRGWQVWGNLLHSVETGQPAFERVFGQSYFAEQQESAEALARFDAALAPSAAKTGKALAKLVAPSDCVADLGCGSGALLIEVLRAWPDSRGLAIDSERALALAQSRFEAAGLAGRVRTCPADFFESVPAGASLYVLSLILHDWDDAKALRLLRNCQAAMSPGSRLVILEQLVPEDPRESPQAAHADLGMLVMTGGKERTLNEYRQLLDRAGLRFDSVDLLGGPRKVSVIQATRGLL